MPTVLDDAFAGAAAVVHLAARPSVPRSLADPMASHDANATGTLEVLEAARAPVTPHVVVASSSSVYGANPTLPKHEDIATVPLSPYAASKLATESYALAYQPLLRAAGAGLPLLQRLRAAAGRRATPTPPSCRPSSTPPCAASRSPSTATAPRPVTSPTSAPWRRC